MGSASKLNTIGDGTRILWLIARLFVHERPFAFYGSLALAAIVASSALGIPVVVDFAQSGVVDRLPTAVLAAALGTIGFISLAVGAIHSGVLRMRREMIRLTYLRNPATTHVSRHAF